uniref:uncharacterized protein LOC123456068 n=1 Tax=Jaculus jaculus TaxID=51337 RepID=UPI001E1B3CBD|nr:uncharacterized protein LOC123456068 [Jaculus jaculus]
MAQAVGVTSCKRRSCRSGRLYRRSHTRDAPTSASRAPVRFRNLPGENLKYDVDYVSHRHGRCGALPEALKYETVSYKNSHRVIELAKLRENSTLLSNRTGIRDHCRSRPGKMSAALTASQRTKFVDMMVNSEETQSSSKQQLRGCEVLSTDGDFTQCSPRLRKHCQRGGGKKYFRALSSQHELAGAFPTPPWVTNTPTRAAWL